jgi:hypothetical protein
LKFTHGGSGLKKAICELYCYNTGNTIRQERSFVQAISQGVSAADREALAITGLDEFLFKTFFETGHKIFFGLLLAIVIVWAPVGLLGKWMGKKGVREES